MRGKTRGRRRADEPARGGGDYGNALLSRHPVREVRRLDLSYPNREPRGALDVAIETPAGAVRVIVTHLGLLPDARLASDHLPLLARVRLR